MRYRRVTKAAGVIRAGDYLEHEPMKNLIVCESVHSVRHMMFDGEFDGKKYHNTAVVRVEVGSWADGDYGVHIIPASMKVKLWLPNK